VNPERIIRNSARCLLCGDGIESEYGHDFRYCSCRNLAADGGKGYLRRVFGKEGTWIETSIVEVQQPGDWDEILQALMDEVGEVSFDDERLCRSLLADIAQIIVERGFTLEEVARRMGFSVPVADLVLRRLTPVDADDLLGMRERMKW